MFEKKKNIEVKKMDKEKTTALTASESEKLTLFERIRRAVANLSHKANNESEKSKSPRTPERSCRSVLCNTFQTLFKRKNKEEELSNHQKVKTVPKKVLQSARNKEQVQNYKTVVQQQKIPERKEIDSVAATGKVVQLQGKKVPDEKKKKIPVINNTVIKAQKPMVPGKKRTVPAVNQMAGQLQGKKEPDEKKKKLPVINNTVIKAQKPTVIGKKRTVPAVNQMTVRLQRKKKPDKKKKKLSVINNKVIKAQKPTVPGKKRTVPAVNQMAVRLQGKKEPDNKKKKLPVINNTVIKAQKPTVPSKKRTVPAVNQMAGQLQGKKEPDKKKKKLPVINNKVPDKNKIISSTINEKSVQKSVQLQEKKKETQIISPTIDGKSVQLQEKKIISSTIDGKSVQLQEKKIISSTIDGKSVQLQEKKIETQIISPTIDGKSVQLQEKKIETQIISPTIDGRSVQLQEKKKETQRIAPTINGKSVQLQEKKIETQIISSTINGKSLRLQEKKETQRIAPTINGKSVQLQEKKIETQIISPTINGKSVQLQEKKIETQIISPTINGKSVQLQEKKISYGKTMDLPAVTENIGNVQEQKKPKSGMNLNEAQVQNTRVVPVSWGDLNQFEMLKFLGEGAFGEVLLAEHIVAQKKVAIKIMKDPSHTKKRSIRVAFEIDVMQLATENKFPFLVNFISSFKFEDRTCIVMEYAERGELASVIRHKRTARLVVFYTACVVLGIQFLHKNKIIHRDLKPQNILIDREGYAKIADFGLSEIGSGEEELVNGLIGSYAYMPPELYIYNYSTKALDWWALGVILYKLFFGTLPFNGVNCANIKKSIVYDEPTLPPYMPPERRILIEGLLNKDYRKRLGSGPTDAVEVMKAEFFKGTNWKGIRHREVIPPDIPKLKKKAPQQGESTAS